MDTVRAAAQQAIAHPGVHGWPGALAVTVLALLVSVLGGWLVTTGVLRAASRAPDAQQPSAVLRGGQWIGFLERTAVTLAMVAGQPGTVAVVVAVKALGRYPELRDRPAASERFVVGTLASLLWAAVVGWLARSFIAF